MAGTDRAIVVGVRYYPDLGDLDGPENDARAFYDWLIDPMGGDVPVDNVKRILSSDFNPPFRNATNARPTTERIEEAFDELADLAANNPVGRWIGRRLYLYFAGHGFAPPPQSKDNEAGLLMANATRLRTGYHILGRAWARRFLLAGYFDEVLLFMDCCRENYRQAPLNLPKHNELLAPGAVDNTSYFYAFGAKLARKVRERTMDDGLVHGVFTSAVLAGLWGDARNSAGVVTADSLGGYLFNNMRNFLTSEDLNDPDVATEPELEYHPVAGSNFVIATPSPPATAAPTFPVTLHLARNRLGQQLKILRNGDFALVTSLTPTASTAPLEQGYRTVRLALEQGWYIIAANGIAPQVIDISGTGGCDVYL